MNTILVWVLVIVSGVPNSNTITYSPPMPDLAMCQHLQNATDDMARLSRSKCVQIRMVVTK